MVSSRLSLTRKARRDFYHSLEYDKLAFTKVRLWLEDGRNYYRPPRLTILTVQSLIHTRRQSEGWVLPGAHFLKHATLDRAAAKIITADGQPVKVILNDAGARTGKQGVAYMGKHYAPRVYEPLVMFHYVERGESASYLFFQLLPPTEIIG